MKLIISTVAGLSLMATMGYLFSLILVTNGIPDSRYLDRPVPWHSKY